MNRPLVLRAAPKRVVQSVYYRYYHRRHAAWPDLFPSARLAFAEELEMFNLPAGDVIAGNIAFTGFYELELSRKLAGLARNGGLLVDIGANMGYFSLLWCGNHPSATAVAFEVAPRNVEMLKTNVQRNSLSDRISIVAKAASNTSGEVSFDMGPPEQTGWGGITSSDNATAIRLPAVRIDEEMPDATIDVLKIDVEGADTLVLEGCEQLLRAKRIRNIFFEQNEARMKLLGIQKDDAAIFLGKLGYSCEPLDSSGLEWFARPSSNATATSS